MASGRLLREPVAILERRRRRRLSATVRTSREDLAEIRIRWVKSASFPGYPVADGEITFPDGDGWTMAVEAPDRPPDPPKLLSRLRRPRHSILERIVRVRDRRSVVLAEASWPESSGENIQRRKAENREQRTAARRKIAAAAADTARSAGSTWVDGHRRGRLGWLLTAGVAIFLALGFLPAAIVTLATSEVGPGLAFAVVTLASVWLAVVAWRRWRAPSASRAAHRRPSGTGGSDATGIRGAAASAFEWIGHATEALALEDTNPTIVVDGTAEVLRPSGAGWGRTRFEVGTLRIQRRRRRTELVPGAPVPVEAAVLAWLVVKGDVIFPQDAGGGG